MHACICLDIYKNGVAHITTACSISWFYENSFSVKNVLIHSGEAHFKIDGCVDKDDDCIRSEENTGIFYEKSLHSQQGTVHYGQLA